MRIAFFVSEFPAPSETFVVAQIAGLIDRGHDVQIFGRRPRRLPPDPLPQRYGLRARTHYYKTGLSTLPTAASHTLTALRSHPSAFLSFAQRMPAQRPRSPDEAVTLWACAAALLSVGPRFDAVVAHFGPNALLAQRMRELGALRGGLLSVFHGRDASHAILKHGRDYYRPVFAHSELVLPVSEYFARRLRELGCPSERILVHRMGVDLKRFAYRARTLAEGEPVRVLSVCRLVEKKGVDVALRAAAVLRDAGVGFEYRILGDGPELSKLRALCRQLGLESHVQLRGAATRDEVQSALAEAHVFVAPSITGADGDEEGVPVAIMEAAAAGLPVASTLHSGIPELVRDGHTGVLAPERDHEALAAKLLELIRAPERWASLGAAGRALVAAEHDNDALLDRLVQLAERAAHEHATGTL